jgi:hypothetical protein
MGMKRAGIFDGAGGAGATFPYWTTNGTNRNDFGLIGNIPNYINQAANAGVNALTNDKFAPLTTAGASLGQFAIQNASQGSADVLNTLVGKAAPQGPGYVSWGNTWGQKMYDQQNNQQKGGALSNSGTMQQGQLVNPTTQFNPMTGTFSARGQTPIADQGLYRGLYGTGADYITGTKYDTKSGSFVPSGALSNSGTVNPSNPAQNPPTNPMEEGNGSSPYDGYSSASMFAYAMMNDMDKLRSLPGFEGVDPDSLPYGASIGKQLESLYETLTWETGLNQAMDSIMESTQTYNDFLQGGVGLNERLTDYVRRRDVYLNKTTSMIDDFKQKIYSGAVNTYDPNIAQRARSYLGYLGTLQGRQNKRYVEWLGQSVNVYGQQLQASAQMVQNNMNIYDKKLADFQTRYEQGSKIAIYEYEQLRDLLVETYNTAAGLSTTQLEQQKMQLEMQGIALDNAKKTLEIEKGVNGINPDSAKAWEFLRKQGTLYDQDTGATTPLGRNIYGMIDMFGPKIEMGADGSTYETGGLVDIDTIMASFNACIANDFKSGGTLNDYFAKAQDYYAGIDSLRGSANYAPEQQAFWDSQMSQLKLSVTQPLINRTKDMILADETLSNAMREAVTSLTKPAFWGSGLKDLPEKDDFIKEYKALGLPEFLLGQMYDQASDLRENSTDQDIVQNARALYADSSKYDLSSVKITQIPTSELVNQVLFSSLFGPTQFQGQGL